MRGQMREKSDFQKYYIYSAEFEDTPIFAE
jgi:hypothetical protein